MKHSSVTFRHGVAALLAAAAVGCPISTVAEAGAKAAGPVSPLTDPAQIEQLATKAFVWGLAPEFVYRFENYNNLTTAPVNTFAGVASAAAWNNNATNAGNASVLYLQSMLDLSGQTNRGGTKELVLTVPPSSSNYYVVALLDAFINAVGSIGARTTPSTDAQSYLLVGPTSKYAHKKTVQINGVAFKVLPFATNLGWILIRIRADSLLPAGDPASLPTILTTVVERFALNTLADYQAKGNAPTYFVPGQYKPTSQQINLSAPWQNMPTSAVAFFGQVGEALRQSPLPAKTTGLNGIKLSSLPSWMAAQSGATSGSGRFFNPSYPQASALALFKPLGLTAKGFTLPGNWGPAQVNAFQSGFQDGQTQVNDAAATVNASPATNFWAYLNSGIGNYPNTEGGYQDRATVVILGGSANLGLDAMYAQINNTDGTSATQLDGNNTYKLTLLPPVVHPATLPVVGTLPPTVNDSQGNPLGLWSIIVYQTDSTQAAAPFIPQTSVQNTAYSSANITVTAVDAATDTITVEPSAWGPLVASTPILFSATAAQYGLTPGVPYYVATAPSSQAAPSFTVTAVWKQPLSAAHVPIQGNQGAPGPIVDLTNPGGAVDLMWGPIQPVSQLGSQQLASGKLAKNPDGSVTLWIAPTLPAGAPETNWIPTPSTAYYSSIYPGVAVPTQIRPMIRVYYPTPGSDTEASILPPPNGSMAATYVFPALEKVSGN